MKSTQKEGKEKALLVIVAFKINNDQQGLLLAFFLRALHPFPSLLSKPAINLPTMSFTVSFSCTVIHSNLFSFRNHVNFRLAKRRVLSFIRSRAWVSSYEPSK